MKNIVMLLVMLLSITIAYAKETHFVVPNGNVDNVISWSNGIPVAGDNVSIDYVCTVYESQSISGSNLTVNPGVVLTNYGDLTAQTIGGNGRIYNYGVIETGLNSVVTYMYDGYMKSNAWVVGDFNNDGIVDFLDFAIFANGWLTEE